MSAGELTIPQSTIRRFGVGVLGGGDITNNLSVDANLQYNLLSRGRTASGVYGNVNVTWRLSPQWSVAGTYYDNRDDTANLFVLDPLIPTINALPTQRSRAVMLSDFATRIAPGRRLPRSGAGRAVRPAPLPARSTSI